MVHNSVSDKGYRIGYEISFTMRITNTGNISIASLTVQDAYNRVFLDYTSATPAPVAPTDDDRVLDWTLDFAAHPLDLGASTAITLYFTTRTNTMGQLPAGDGCDDTHETCTKAWVTGGRTVSPPDGGQPVDVPPAGPVGDDVQILTTVGVNLADRTVTITETGVLIQWHTITEVGVVAYNVWRDSGGSAVLITASPMAATFADQPLGAAYRVRDETVAHDTAYTYVLEMLHTNDHRERHVIGAIAPKALFLPILSR